MGPTASSECVLHLLHPLGVCMYVRMHVCGAGWLEAGAENPRGTGLTLPLALLGSVLVSFNPDYQTGT